MEKIEKNKSDKVIILTMVFLVGLSFLLILIQAPKQNTKLNTGPKNNTENSTVSVEMIKRLVLLVKYNNETCPELQVEHTNNETNETEILDIKTVKKVNESMPTINFVGLGAYNMNSGIKPEIRYINQGNCTPQALLISNEDFINLLLSYGVPIEEND